MNKPELIRLLERRPIGKDNKLRWYGEYKCPVCGGNTELFTKPLEHILLGV